MRKNAPVRVKTNEFAAAIGQARKASEAPVDKAEVASVVENIVSTMEGDLSVADVRLYRELEALVKFIESAKREISAIRPEQIGKDFIPSATDELDAIVGATEDATGVILDSAEKLEQLAGKMDGEAAQAVTDVVTKIYEACNFQDITGQRVTKVVKTLRAIEEKIEALVRLVGPGPGAAEGAAPAPRKEPAAGKSAEAVTDSALMNGPQLPDKAQDQAAIDALFSND